MKTCCKCKQSKNSSEFNKKKHSKNGLQYRCKDCMVIYHKQHYQDNVQYYKDKAVKHRKKPVDHIRKYKLTEEENKFLINALHEYRGGVE